MARRKRLTPLRLSVSPDDPPAPQAPEPARRRPPIAGVAGEAAAIAALGEVEAGLENARQDGRLLLRIPLDDIDANYLVRDRIVLDADDMAALEDSLKRRGQQTPIEVADLGEDNPGGRYGLISGWRRVQALGSIGAGQALAAVRTPEGSAAAWQAMVEENEVRAALSYYERARIAVRAAEAGVHPDARSALAALFASSSRSRRSKIGSFMRIVDALDGVLAFPAAIGERQGLALAKALEAPGAAARIAKALKAAKPADATAEGAAIAAALQTRADKAAGSERKRLARETLRPGLYCRETRDGFALSGPALSDDLKKRIRALLREG